MPLHNRSLDDDTVFCDIAVPTCNVRFVGNRVLSLEDNQTKIICSDGTLVLNSGVFGCNADGNILTPCSRDERVDQLLFSDKLSSLLIDVGANTFQNLDTIPYLFPTTESLFW